MNRYLVCVFVMVLSGMMFICSYVYAVVIQFDSIEKLQKQDTNITLSMSAIQIEGIKGLSKVENDVVCAVKLQEIGIDTACPIICFAKGGNKEL